MKFNIKAQLNLSTKRGFLYPLKKQPFKPTPNPSMEGNWFVRI
jgi:hypothetical protein